MASEKRTSLGSLKQRRKKRIGLNPTMKLVNWIFWFCGFGKTSKEIGLRPLKAPLSTGPVQPLEATLPHLPCAWDSKKSFFFHEPVTSGIPVLPCRMVAILSWPIYSPCELISQAPLEEYGHSFWVRAPFNKIRFIETPPFHKAALCLERFRRGFEGKPQEQPPSSL